MIKYLKFKFSFWKARRLLRKKSLPDKSFLERARAAFLSHLRRPGGTIVLVSRRFGLGLRYIVTFVVIVALNGALVAFAQGQNISPAQPLYPFKRLGEDIALTFAPAGQKPYLHKQFAARRLEEIKEISVASSTNKNGMVTALRDDFKTEVDEAFESAKKNNVKIDTISFCSSFGSMISERGKNGKSMIGEEKWESFKKYCGSAPSNFKIELE